MIGSPAMALTAFTSVASDADLVILNDDVRDATFMVSFAPGAYDTPAIVVGSGLIVAKFLDHI